MMHGAYNVKEIRLFMSLEQNRTEQNRTEQNRTTITTQGQLTITPQKYLNKLNVEISNKS